MSRHLLRRAVDEAMNRTGMIVGLPKCTVDAGQLRNLLDQCDAAEAEVARLKDAIREHRDSFSKDMDEHDWTTEDEALWALVEEAAQ